MAYRQETPDAAGNRVYAPGPGGLHGRRRPGVLALRNPNEAGATTPSPLVAALLLAVSLAEPLSEATAAAAVAMVAGTATPPAAVRPSGAATVPRAPRYAGSAIRRGQPRLASSARLGEMM